MKQQERRRDDPVADLNACGVRDAVPALENLASTLFDGPIDVQVECDPELCESAYLVFRVTATGDLDSIAKREDEWNRAVRELLGTNAGKVSLAIDVA